MKALEFADIPIPKCPSLSKIVLTFRMLSSKFAS